MRPVVPPAEVAAMRAAAQLLSDGPPRRPADTVERMLALQAQDFAGALWAVAVRDGAEEAAADIEAALTAGEVVRSWPMRGTLHLVLPRDLRLLLAVTSARAVAAAAGRRAQLGLTEEQLERGRELTIELLSGGRALPRAQLMAAISARGLDMTGQRAAHLLGWLSQTGVTCLGPMLGTQQGVVLLDEWAPGPTPERAAAVREVTVRYVRGHGPATVADLAWWTGLTRREAAQAVADVADQLDRIDTETGPMWLAPDSPAARADAVASAAAGVRLLPAFDELLLGYRDRSASLEPTHSDRVGSNGLFRPIISVGGRVVGTWRVERRAAPSVAFDAFRPLPSEVLPALDAMAAGHLRFAGFR